MLRKIENARNNLLARGKEILLEKGYCGLSIAGLTAQCGMGTSTFYNYFPSKDSLVMQIISDDWNRMLKSVKKGASTSADYYTNCRYLYGVISDFQYKYRFFGTGTIIKTKEIILMERKGLQQLYDIIAEKFEKAAEAGALEIGTSPENAAYMLVQSCMVASRNPEMNFKDLWGFLHVREGSADAQQCAPPMKR